MRKFLSLSIVLILCLSAISAIAEAPASSAWAAAFDGAARLILTPVPLPCEIPEDENREIKLLGLSPDGKTLLCRVRETVISEPQENSGSESLTGSQLAGRNRGNTQAAETLVYLALIRDGEFIPVHPNAERGDGDPYGTLDKVMNFPRRLSGAEDFSWSADSRYLTCSNVMIACVEPTYSLDVPVVDTLSGELWLAASYQNKNRLLNGFGQVLLCRMSRNSDFIYYLLLANESDSFVYQFCRCAPEGGSVEILCDIPWNEEGKPFTLTSSSNLLETDDGSWLITATDRNGRYREDCTVFIRFAPSGDGWSADMRSTGIPRRLTPARFSWSDVSGYGLFVMLDTYATENANDSTPSVSVDLYDLYNHVNLVRTLPGAEFIGDSWYLRRMGENPADLVLVSGEEYLQFFQSVVAGGDFNPPADYDPEELRRHPLPLIFNACLFPDGQYALLAVNVHPEEIWQFFLLRLATMEICPVNAPAGLASQMLAISPISRGNWPCMVWNADGTLLIFNSSGNLETFRVEVE